MAVNGRTRIGRMEQPTTTNEPYRLWFEFLKLALSDPDISVNTDYYNLWGDYQGSDFNTWWNQHWLNLFAVDIGVYKIKDFQKLFLDRRNEIIVRLPLYRDPSDTLKRVKAILELERASARLRNTPDGQFKLDSGHDASGKPINPATRFLRNLTNVGVLLNFYRFWIANGGLEDGKRYEKTAWDYYNWLKDGQHIKRALDIGLDPRHMPPGLEDYVSYLDHRDGGKTGQPSLGLGPGNVDQRRQIVRFVTKAKKIAANVGRGQFPGKYE